jgi:hypothetical protein
MDETDNDFLLDSQRDFTEWKLLLQSLYSKIRSFPLSLSLLNGTVKKSQLYYRFETIYLVYPQLKEIQSIILVT